MADTIRWTEDTTKRRQEYAEIKGVHVILYHRVYNIAAGATFPARGDAVDLDGVSGSGVFQPHVYQVPKVQQSQGSQTQVAITFYQLRAWVAPV